MDSPRPRNRPSHGAITGSYRAVVGGPEPKTSGPKSVRYRFTPRPPLDGAVDTVPSAIEWGSRPSSPTSRLGDEPRHGSHERRTATTVGGSDRDGEHDAVHTVDDADPRPDHRRVTRTVGADAGEPGGPDRRGGFPSHVTSGTGVDGSSRPASGGRRVAGRTETTVSPSGDEPLVGDEPRSGGGNA